MVWKGLPEGRQREVLEVVPEWLQLLAVVVLGTTEGALRSLASVATPGVSKVLNASPNVSDEMGALAALSSQADPIASVTPSNDAARIRARTV